MKITAVQYDKVDQVWGEVKANVTRCLDTQRKHAAVNDSTYNEEEVLAYLKRGDGLLLVIHEDDVIVASLMVEVLNTDAGRSLNLVNMGGSRIHEWYLLLLEEIISIAENHNCNDIRIYMVRKAWSRCLKPYGFNNIGNRVYADKSYPVISYKIKD